VRKNRESCIENREKKAEKKNISLFKHPGMLLFFSSAYFQVSLRMH